MQRLYKATLSVFMVVMLMASSIQSPISAEPVDPESPAATPVIEAIPSGTESDDQPATDIDPEESSDSGNETTDPDLETSDDDNGDLTPEVAPDPADHENEAPNIAPAATGNEQMTISRTSGLRLSFVEFNGTGFAPYSSIEMFWDPEGDNELYTARADENGKIKFGFTVPNRADNGTYTIVMHTLDNEWQKSFTFEITGSPAPLMSIWPESGAVGDSITIVGSAFRPNESINLRHGSETGPVIDTFSAFEDGGVYVDFEIPAGAATGSNVFWLIGDRGQKGFVTVEVYSSDSPAFQVTPSTGHPNDVISFEGRFFEPDEEVTLRRDSASGVEITSVIANGKGEIRGTFMIPGATPTTTYTIIAVSASGQATATFTTTSDTALSATVSPTTVIRGNSVTITGSGYPANQDVNIFVGQIGWLPDHTVTASASGTFSTNLLIPADSKPGALEIFIADYRGYYAKSTIEVTVEPATLVATPSTVLQRGVVEFSGTGFNSGESVTITLAGDEITTVQADGQGEISGTITIPDTLLAGTHELVATGEGDQVASTTVTVISNPVIMADPSSARAGSTITVSVHGFQPNELITIRISGYNGPILGEAHASAHGSLTTTVTIPHHWTPSTPWLSAEGASGTRARIPYPVTGYAQPVIMADPSSARAGTSITVSVYGFQPNELITIRISGYNGPILREAPANSHGSLTTTVTIPHHWKPSTPWLSAEGASGTRARIGYPVTGASLPGMSVDPPSAHPGTSISVSAYGFHPNELITIRISGYNGPILGQARADGHGLVTTAVTIPHYWTPSTPWLSADGPSGTRVRIPYPVTGYAQPVITADPPSARAGSSISVSVHGFQPNELITIRISGYNGPILGQARANALGSVTTTVTIPAHWTPSTPWLSAEGPSGTRVRIGYPVTGP